MIITMNKIIDIVMGLILSLFVQLIIIYKALAASDIPVTMDLAEYKQILCLLIFILILYSFYIKKTKYTLLNIAFLLFPLAFCCLFMKQSLQYNYSKYDTLSNVFIFLVILIIFLQLTYKEIKKIKSSRNKGLCK